MPEKRFGRNVQTAKELEMLETLHYSLVTRMKAYRKANKINTEQAMYLFGSDKRCSTWLRIEYNHNYSPNLLTLIRIAKIMGIQLHELISPIESFHSSGNS